MASKAKIEAVKRIPIPTYMKEVVVPRLGGYYGSGEGYFEYRPVEKCPLHGEDTPSFRYYEETNTCSCFGCRRGGSIINLHMYFFQENEGIEVAFDDAVDWLYKRFVEGSNAGEVKASKISNNEQSSKAKEYAKELEQTQDKDVLSTVDTMRSERKIFEAFEKMRVADNTNIINYRCVESADLIERLYKTNNINAKEAANYIELIAKQQV